MTKSGTGLQARGFASVLLIIYLFVPASILSQTNARRRAASPLVWPTVTNQSRPWTRWWWHGSAVSAKDLTAELEKYRQAGLGGVEITPIYGVRGEEPRFINFLSPEWMGMLEHSLKEAARLRMGVDLATGTGWPFGGPWVGDADAPKYFVHKTYRVRGGEKLSEPVTYVQRPLLRAVGRHAHTSEIKDPVSANENLQALALDQVRFKKALPLQALMAYSDKGATLDLTKKVGADGKLDWVAPAGDWTLYALFQGWHGKMVERAAPGGEGNVIDHFSARSLKNYLTEFDRAFAGRDTKTLRAFFNDSYEVDDADGEANWTADFFGEFRARRGYDLREHLPALAGNDSAEKSARVLYDFRETISDLLLDEFTIAWRRWAATRGAIIRNQAHGSPANILDLYAASDIPETEGTDIIRMKFASSAANLTGKRLASAEAATWLNEHFTSTLGDVKNAVDLYFLGGINHVVYHGTPFSPPGEAWPGRLFYAAVHFGPSNSFWNDFSALNNYIARAQSFLQSGQSDNDVLLYYPIHDRWSERGKETLVHVGGGHDAGIAMGDAQTMLDAGYTFDLISDRQLKNVFFVGDSPRAGRLPYKVVVLPESRLIPLETFAKLIELARAGATVIVVKNLPSDVPGWANSDGRRNTLQRLVAQLRFENTDDAGVQRAKIGRGEFLRGDDLKQMLSLVGVRREAMTDQGLQFSRRRHGSGNYYFILNRGGKFLDGWVPLRTSAKSVAIFDPAREEAGMGALRAGANGGKEVYLQLAPGESRVLKTFDRVVRAPSYRHYRSVGEPQPLRGEWSVRFTSGGPELPSSVRINELGSWTNYGGEAVKRFAGTGVYAISFARPAGETDGWLLDLGRVAESARVRLNGRDLGALITAPFRLHVPKELWQEQNTLEVTVSNLMANRIADLDRRKVNWKKFYNVNFPSRLKENAGPDGLFSAAKWTPKESGLIGPVTLAPVETLRFQENVSDVRRKRGQYPER